MTFSEVACTLALASYADTVWARHAFLQPVGDYISPLLLLVHAVHCYSIITRSTGRKIAPNTGANAPKFFTLATKS